LSSTADKKALRVLVVDDHLDTVQSVVRLARHMGHEVEFAINATAALASAQRFRPDVVLLDLRLPDADGGEVARQLRRNPDLKSVRIVCITGLAGEEDRRRALAAGCDQFFLKPLGAGVLERVLSS